MFRQYKKFLIPIFLCLVIASSYMIIDSGKVGGDAIDYEELSNSILTGKYSIDGATSMLREPGYPFFRAVLKWLHFSMGGILWIQILLYAITIFFVGLTCFKIDNRAGVWGAWGAALSYGLAFYPSHHLSETLTAFFLSIIGLLFITTLDNPRCKHWIFLGMASGVLLLTRYAFFLIPIVSAAAIIITAIKNKMLDRKELAINVVLMFLIMGIIISPWVIRNYNEFGEANIAGRSGNILYARAWKAEKSWRSLFDSYISVFIGRGLLFTIYPTSQPIFQEQWDWQRDTNKLKLLGDSNTEVNKNLRKEAFGIIFKDFNQFAKFAAWTGVDGLRLLALPNPVIEAQGSPIEGTYGPLAKEEGLSLIQIIALASVHIIQLLWFVCIVLSIIFGFRKYGFRFIPGILLIGFILPHLAIDDTARFAAPMQPWLLSGIFITILYPLYKGDLLDMKFF